MAQFIIKNTMAEMSSLSPAEINDLQTGAASGVLLCGYYQKGDTPDPIVYYLSTTSGSDDQFQIIAVGGVKLEHQFIDFIDIRYAGSKSDPTFDNRAIIQKVIDTGKNVYISHYAYISDSLLIDGSNQKIYGNSNDSLIEVNDPDKNAIYINGASFIEVSEIKFKVKEKSSPVAYKAIIYIYNSNNCIIKHNNIFDFSYWGIVLHNSNFNTIENNTIKECYSNSQMSSDIAIYESSQNNTINNNVCLGEKSDNGIMLIDPYTDSYPTDNKILNNYIDEHATNGIICYITHPINTKTQIIGNTIKNIQGTGLDNRSGCGIYIQSFAGTIIENNLIENCCIVTDDFDTQVVGHIGIAIGDYRSEENKEHFPILITNNQIICNRGVAINVATSQKNVSIISNHIINNATEGARKESIRIINALDVSIINNNIQHNVTSNVAIGLNVSLHYETQENIIINSVLIEGNSVTSKNSCLAFSQLDENSGYDKVIINGNNFNSNFTQTSFIEGIIGSLIFSNNILKSDDFIAQFNKCQNISITGNTFIGNQSNISLAFTNNLTSGYVSESNLFNCLIGNDSPLMNITMRKTSVVYGGYQKGDRIINIAPSIGDSKSWICTTAGYPGTWTSEGIL